jgi:hypothetical protein
MLNSGDPQMVAWAESDDSQRKPDEAAVESARAFAHTIVSAASA